MSRCDAALIPAVTLSTLSMEEQKKFLWQIDEETYNFLKTGAGGSFSYFGIGGDADYATFSEGRRRYTGLNDRESQIKLNQFNYRSELKPAQLKVFLECVEAELDAEGSGIKCIIASADDEFVTVVFRWVPPAGGSEANVTYSSLRGGVPYPADVTVPDGHAIQPGFVLDVNASIPRTYRRVKNTTFGVVMGVGPGFSGTAVVEYQPEKKEQIQKICHIYRLPGEPTYDEDVTNKDISTCRQKTAEYTQTDGRNYSFKIRLLDEKGRLLVEGKQNTDDQWPELP